MKRIFPIHLFCLSGVALVLGACTSEVTDGGNTPADGPVPISFQTPETRRPRRVRQKTVSVPTMPSPCGAGMPTMLRVRTPGRYSTLKR